MSASPKAQLEQLQAQRNQIKAARNDTLDQLEKFDTALAQLDAMIRGAELGLAVAREEASTAYAAEPSVN